VLASESARKFWEDCLAIGYETREGNIKSTGIGKPGLEDDDEEVDRAIYELGMPLLVWDGLAVDDQGQLEMLLRLLHAISKLTLNPEGCKATISEKTDGWGVVKKPWCRLNVRASAEWDGVAQVLPKLTGILGKLDLKRKSPGPVIPRHSDGRETSMDQETTGTNSASGSKTAEDGCRELE
jgi:hypothetical protein